MHSIVSILAAALCLTGAAAGAAADGSSPPAPFALDDYAKISRITELAISADGALVAYAAERASEERDGFARRIFIQETGDEAQPRQVLQGRNASQLAWIPGTRELAYLAAGDHGAQLYATAFPSRKTRQITNSRNPVVWYAFSNSGELAWITQDAPAPGEKGMTLYERLHEGDRGVVVNPEFARLYDFIDPFYSAQKTQRPRTLWLARPGERAARIDLPGDPASGRWSPDATRLSVAYAARTLPERPFIDAYASIGVLDVAAGEFRTVGAARYFSGEKPARYFLGGEWSAEGDALYLRRVTQDSLWRGRQEWRRLPLERRRGETGDRAAMGGGWKPLDFYPAGSAILDSGEGRVFVNAIKNGRRKLYSLSGEGGDATRFRSFPDGDLSRFRFTGDYRSAVFVSESLVRPPEVYFWRKGQAPRQLTSLNGAVSARQMPASRAVRWHGRDGSVISGWLLEPPDAHDNPRPRPLLTFVHGGPSMPMTDSFAQYYTTNGGIWPYPLEALAMKGVSVFIPNYRGARSFGDEFANPSRPDGQPLQDISLGIDALIKKGVADPGRLAVAGHSHGAWLGALVVTRRKDIVAASFGEGPQNNFLTYIFSPGYLYANGYHKLWGASPYDSPQTYIETSPVFEFDGAGAAILFESGVRYQAIAMLESPKAAALSGLPAEFVVYPKTGHNIRSPDLQIESAARNLDWVLFWLTGVEDPSPDKREQYRRWRRLRKDASDDLSSQWRRRKPAANRPRQSE
ncbi:S9 family peptidase [Hyphococcus luteus]|nr:alpha/beta fold hydrolase [Marinicaulis flavus]